MIRVTILSSVLIVCLGITFEPALASDGVPLWGPTLSLGLESFRAGKFDDAVKLLTAALTMAEKAGDKEQQGHILSDLSVVYFAQGKDEEGEKCVLAAAKCMGNGDELTDSNLTTYCHLAGIYASHRKYSLAEPLFQRIEKFTADTYGPTDSNMALILRPISGMYVAQGKFEKAEEALNRALSITKKNSGAEGAQVAVIISDLAQLYNEEGKYAEAAEISKEALAIDEKMYSGDHPNVSFTLRDLGIAQTGLGNYSEAELLLKKALAMQERLLGQTHPTVAVTMASLGKLYTKQDKYDDAKQLFDRAIEIRSAAHFDHDRKMVSMLRAYAELEKLRKDPAEALKLEQRANSIEK